MATWGPLIEQARKSVADSEFDVRERNPKLLLADAFEKALQMARDKDEDWGAQLKRAFALRHDGQTLTLSHFTQHQWLFKVTGEAQEALRVSLAGFLDPELDPISRFASFADVARTYAADKKGQAPGAILIVGSTFNFAVDPFYLPPVKTSVYRKVEELVSYEAPPSDAVDAYAHHLEFTSECYSKVVEAGVELRDFLDLQSVFWEAARSRGGSGFTEAVLGLLKGGLTTYKQATILALARLARRRPEPPSRQLPVADLAREIVTIYWQQARGLDPEGTSLRQTQSGSQLEVLQLLEQFRDEPPDAMQSIGVALFAEPDTSSKVFRDVEYKLAEDPLPRLDPSRNTLGGVDWDVQIPLQEYWERQPRYLELSEGVWQRLSASSRELEAKVRENWSSFVADIAENHLERSETEVFLFPPEDSLGLLLRWSLSSEPETIRLHRDVVDEHGSVWWGKKGDPSGKAAMSKGRYDEFQQRLDSGVPTFVFLYRAGETWRARMLALRKDRPDAAELIPSYYRDDLDQHHLWVRLADLERLYDDYPQQSLVLDGSDDPASIDKAFKGMSNLLYVRERDADDAAELPRRFWWVNQNDTYAVSRDGGFLWAPLVNAAGHHVPHWDRLEEAGADDLVLHCASGKIVAVGTVVGSCEMDARPDEFPTDSNWADDGYRLPVAYRELAEPISISDIPSEWRTAEAGAFTKVGAVLQGYFFQLSEEFAAAMDERFPELQLGLSVVTNTPTMDSLAKLTLWKEPDLEELIKAIKERGQVILAGPPGTGKTWVAKAVAEYLTGKDDSRVELVQFHPSYGYEEFVEGLRPKIRDNVLTFGRVNGKVLELKETIGDSTETYVLIIDELNRANIPRVFGELMYLLEYRDEEIELQYSTGFKLPKNLKFIATMNTADRSIRSIDVALRRRFDIFECPSDPDILTRFYADPGRESKVPGLIDGFTELNKWLTERLDRHHTIGQSFFMAESLTATDLNRTWKRQIKPLIEDYLFDQPAVTKDLGPEEFWPEL